MSPLPFQADADGSLLAMHATDGLFSMPVNVLFAVIVAIIVGAAILRLARRGDHRLAPVMGVMAAFVFAAQMVNFPIAPGVAGHLLGGTLAAILLGPWAGTVVMAVVIIFQAMLGDGGITVLGPNIFNMGIIGTCLAYYVYRAIVGQPGSQPGRTVAAGFFASWLAVVLASVFVSLQLAVSGRSSLNRVLPAMVLVHMAIGIGEALITAGVLAFIIKTRPALLYDWNSRQPSPAGRAMIVLGLGVSLAVGALLSLLPTLWESPDGLEFVLAKEGVPFGGYQKEGEGAITPPIALLPNYTVPGIGGLLSTSLAGGLGTIAVFLISFLVGRAFTRPNRLEAALSRATSATNTPDRSG